MPLPRSAPLPQIPFKLDPAAVDRFLDGGTSDRSGGVASGPGWPGWSSFKEKFFLPFVRRHPLPGSRRVTAEVESFLHGIQGNILTPHGRAHSVLLFFRFNGAPAEMRMFLAEADNHVTSALRQYQQARHRSENPNQPFVSIALTKDGVLAAGCRLPPEQGVSFSTGMFKRRARLGDGDWDEAEWNDERPEAAIHGAWLLASAQIHLLEKLEAEIRALGGGRVAVVVRQPGVILRNSEGNAVEPFGFRDGVSMPEFFQHGKAAAGLVNLPLNQVLLDTTGIERGGSFLVYRKLRQHVDRFRDFERTLAAAARQRGVDPVDVGRLLVGRRRNGMPLAELDPVAPGQPGLDLNRFDYGKDAAGARCPFHAHIRKANPRSLLKKVDQPDDHELGVQIVRRGLVFGTGGRTLFNPAAPTPKDTGLLFIAYMADIAEQFEFMQANWLSHAESPADPLNHPDPLLYGGKSNTPFWEWSGLPGVKLELTKFVQTLGGAYLFVPPRAWLRNPPTTDDGAE